MPATLSYCLGKPWAGARAGVAVGVRASLTFERYDIGGTPARLGRGVAVGVGVETMRVTEGMVLVGVGCTLTGVLAAPPANGVGVGNSGRAGAVGSSVPMRGVGVAV